MNIKMIKCKVGAWNESNTHNHKSNSTGYAIISKVLCVFCDKCIAQHCCFYPVIFPSQFPFGYDNISYLCRTYQKTLFIL